jgi:hypothetical protein
MDIYLFYPGWDILRNGSGLVSCDDKPGLWRRSGTFLEKELYLGCNDVEGDAGFRIVFGQVDFEHVWLLSGFPKIRFFKI